MIAETPYYVDERDFVKIPHVDEHIKCGKCGNLIALRSDEFYLVKTVVTMYNLKDKSVTCRCGKCKTFNHIKDKKVSIII